MGIYWLIGIAMYVLNAIAFYRLSVLADRPEIAWFSWIPVLNLIQQLLLIKKSGWWVLLYLIPIVNFIFFIIWNVQLLQAFGKHGAFVLFAIFLSPVYSILWIVWGFSSTTQYTLSSGTGFSA